MPKLTPRPYQQRALERTREAYNHGANRQIIQLPTGTGKTSGYAVNLLDYFPDLAEQGANGDGGVLFLVHRIEIIRQAYETFKNAYPNKWIGLEQAENHATGMEDIIFASVDSLGRLMSERIRKYNRRKMGIIITDEAHHVHEDSVYDNILTYFGLGSQESTRFDLDSGRSPLHVMLSATPQRNDGQGFEKFADMISTQYEIKDAVRDGWLTDIRAYQMVAEGLEHAEPDEQVDFLVKAWQRYARDKKTLAFTRNVDQSVLLADTLNEHEVARAAHVDHSTDDEDRDDAVEGFREGRYNFLTNRLVFTEGFDTPDIQCILDNGPTNSQTRHIQKVGRGLRPHPAARVDDQPDAESRRRAIRESPKDALLYIATFDPTENGLSIVGTIKGDDTKMDPEGQLVVQGLVDIIEHEEEERPERDVREATSWTDLQVRLRRADVWNQTVYNEELQETTDLRWVKDSDEAASLYLERNPKPRSSYDDTPVIIRLRRNENGTADFEKIIVGGWVQDLGHPVSASRKVVEGHFDSVSDGIMAVDRWLRSQDDELYMKMQRGGSSSATARQKNYIKSHPIQADPNTLTEETASILIDNFRIQRKLEDL